MMKQEVMFADGPHAGRLAKIAIPGDFAVGMRLTINDGDTYIVRDGPIARAIQKSQRPFENGAVILGLVEEVK